MPLKIYRNHHIDSERWARYSPRDDDIVIATPIKSGTTWTQGIIANMLFPEGLPGKVWELSPWFENRRVSESDMFQKLESQTHRRFIKSHVAADGIPIHANVRYVSVGRDGRDLIMSLYNHYSNYSEQMLGGLQQRARADGEEFPSAPDTLEEFWQNWCTRGWFEDQHDGWPFWSDLHIMQTWWELREEPNVLLLHYADMLADPGAEISRLARFLDIELSDERLAQILAAVSFDSMKSNAEIYAPRGGLPFKGGGDTFFHKRHRGHWRDTVSPENLNLFELACRRAMTPECQIWMEQGRSAIGISGG